jgi:ParB-like chromosome segregation protein Spo0J
MSKSNVLSFDERLAEKLGKAANRSGKGFSPTNAPEQEENSDVADAEFVWADAGICDDNAFQYRDPIIPDSDDQRDLVAQINRDGQEQPIRGRWHPTKPGRIQVISGHRRKYAVLDGALFYDEDRPNLPPKRIYANAGSNLPNAVTYIGKILVRIDKQPVSDLDMRRRVYQENRNRTNPHAMADARLFKGVRDDLTSEARAAGRIKDDQEVSVRAVAEYLGERDHTRVHRGLALLTLPPAMQKAIDKGVIVDKETKEVFELGERHGRGLLVLKNFPKAQTALFREIGKSRLSGVRVEEMALAQLKVLQEKMPSLEEARNPSDSTGENGGWGGLSLVPDLPTETTATVAELSHLPQLVKDQLDTTEGQVKEASNGLALLNIAPQDLESYMKRVKALGTQVSRLKKEMAKHEKRHAKAKNQKSS